MKTLVLDFSPILYSNFISASSEMKRNGLKPNADGKLDLDAENYKNIIRFKIFQELSSLKGQFGVDEVIIAVDNAKDGYWRKDVYPIYKGQRKAAREVSELDWGGAFAIFDEIKEQIKENTSFKMIDIPKAEGDDIMFVLAEYKHLLNEQVILHSLDHDTVYNLRWNTPESQNIQWWRHVKSTRKPGSYQEVEPGEILRLEMEHILQGDAGDNIKNVKSFSQFSPKFKELYPDKCEIELYEKRFELDELFTTKFGESAYKHPRFGLKSFMKTKLTVEELLNQNPIYEKNYLLNREIALPEGIPPDISQSVIKAYNTPTQQNKKALSTYFKQNGMFELTAKLPFL